MLYDSQEQEGNTGGTTWTKQLMGKEGQPNSKRPPVDPQKDGENTRPQFSRKLNNKAKKIEQG